MVYISCHGLGYHILPSLLQSNFSKPLKSRKLEKNGSELPEGSYSHQQITVMGHTILKKITPPTPSDTGISYWVP